MFMFLEGKWSMAVATITWTYSGDPLVEICSLTAQIPKASIMASRG